MKICFKCGQSKPLSEFVHSKGKPHSLCLECNRTKVRLWKKQNRAKVTAITHAYAQRNQYKKRAHSRVRHAKARGDMEAPKICPSCGAEGKTHAHHDDYSQPLEVQFLCPQCHSNHHHKTP